jgi:hypothetical protein
VLSRVLTACNLPQRASSRSAWTDCLSSVGLSNSLLVGRMTISVKGDDRNLQDSGNDPPDCCPGKPSCNRRQQAHGCQRHLHDGSPAIALREFGRSQFHSCRCVRLISLRCYSRSAATHRVGAVKIVISLVGPIGEVDEVAPASVGLTTSHFNTGARG